MKFSEIIYSKAENILSTRREQAEKLAKERHRDFLKKYPQLADIEKEMRDAALEVIRSVGATGKTADISEMAKKNLEAQEKKKELIKSAGYPEDYLDVPYTCKKCNDTGMCNGKLCECHLALLRELSVGELSCSPILARSTFDSFDLKYYSTVKDAETGFSPREIMGGCYAMMKAYAENFVPGDSSFFFTGGTGLGKTHLALAVLNTVTGKGYNVFYSSVGNIVKRMQKEQHAYYRTDDSVDEEIESADLLIIDDLGAELNSAFGVSAVNELIDNAVISGKSMIIISNLSKDDIENRYGQRVTSRLGEFEILQFVGEDIRQQKK